MLPDVRQLPCAILILSYDHVELTAKCVNQALAFSLPIILFHNGSSVKNRNLLKAQFPTVRHGHCDQNYGFTAGINRAFDLAFDFHEKIIFVTNDCELKKLPTNWNFEILVPQIQYANGKIDSHGGFFEPAKACLSHNKVIPFPANADTFGPRIPGPIAARGDLRFYVPGAAFGLSKKAWESGPRFDETLHTYWEDVDWSQKISQHKISFDPQFLIVHKGKRTTRRISYYSLYLFHRNRRIVSRRYCDKKQRARLEIRLFQIFFQTAIRLVIERRFADFKLILSAFVARPSRNES